MGYAEVFEGLLGDDFHQVDKYILKKYAGALQPYGLNVRESIALIHIVELRQCGGANQGQIGKMIGVTNPAMVKITKRLEEMGLIVRQPDPGDGRSQLLLPTAQGFARNAVCRQAIRETDQAVFSRLTSQERQLLKRIMGKIGAGEACGSAPAVEKA